MDILQLLGIITLISHTSSLCGYIQFVYFFSLGYGFSISAIGVALFIIFKKSLTLWTVILCVLLIIYGVRLSGYLLIREIKSASYRIILKNDSKQDVPLYVEIFVWITVSLLYVGMTAPVSFRMLNQTPDDIIVVIGTIIGYIGFVIEFLADYQKTQVKKKDPKMFASEGLYKIVRCPNYFGELIIWAGVLITGVSSFNTRAQWCVALLGFIGINFVMFSGARRIEIRQDRTYGDNPKYKAYKSKTPIILPFIPLYSVKEYKFLIA
jgi:steroid 5-alpha reductase family enzyme